MGSGLTEKNDNWDGDGRYYYKCVPALDVVV